MYEGKLVRLRASRVEDAETAAEWLNDLETARLLSVHAPQPRALDEVRARLQTPDKNHFAVETLDGRLIGTCSAFEIDARDRRCMIGWKIGARGMRGKGYGSDMIRVFLRYLFHERNLMRVDLGVFAFNESAVHLYEKLGFVREGTLRDDILSRGRYWDTYLYSMLRREYDALYGS